MSYVSCSDNTGLQQMSASPAPTERETGTLLRVKVKCESLSRVQILPPPGLHSPWNSLGQNTGVGSRSLLQGIFPTRGSNPDFPHCRRILYQRSHRGSLRETGMLMISGLTGVNWDWAGEGWEVWSPCFRSKQANPWCVMPVAGATKESLAAPASHSECQLFSSRL